MLESELSLVSDLRDLGICWYVISCVLMFLSRLGQFWVISEKGIVSGKNRLKIWINKKKKKRNFCFHWFSSDFGFKKKKGWWDFNDVFFLKKKKKKKKLTFFFWNLGIWFEEERGENLEKNNYWKRRRKLQISKKKRKIGFC